MSSDNGTSNGHIATAAAPTLPPPPDTYAARSIGRQLLRNWRIVVGVFVLSCIIAALMAVLTNPVYSSAVSLRIDENKPSIAGLEVLTSVPNQANPLSTEMQMMRSTSLAEATVDSLGLQVRASTVGRFAGLDLLTRPLRRAAVLSSVTSSRNVSAAKYRLERIGGARFTVRQLESQRMLTTVAPGEVVQLSDLRFVLSPLALSYAAIDLDVQPFNKAVAGVKARTLVSRPQRDANFVTVRYEDEDQSLASEVPNVLAAKFLYLRDRFQKTEARSTARFLRQRVDTLARQLAATEEALQAFREGNSVVNLPAEASTRVGELARLQAERNAKEAERSALSNAIQSARAAAAKAGPDTPSPYRSLIAFPTLISTNASQFLQALNEAENQRALLLQRRTKEDKDVRALTARVHELEQQLNFAAQTYLDGLSSQVASMDATIASLGQQMKRIPSKEIQFARLERDNKVLLGIFTLLQTRLQEAQISEAVEDSRVHVIDPAPVPEQPVRPSKRKYVEIGALAGLLLGVFVAFAKDALDRTVHTREDLTEATDVSCLGIIPHLSRELADRGSSMPPSVARHKALMMGRAAMVNPRNPATEAYRSVRTNLMFALPNRDNGQVVVFSSPTPGDGKTTTVSNLATTFAQQDRRVILLDGDLRRGTLHDVFDLPREGGLADVLSGRLTLADALHVVDLESMGKLHVVTSGTFPPNPSELIGSDRLRALIRELRGSYDVIVFDSAPLNLVTDTAILGALADGVVLVGRAGKTEKGALSYATELLRKVRAPLIGTVLNDFDEFRDNRYTGDSGYGYYYSGSYSDYVANGQEKPTRSSGRSSLTS